MGLVLFLVNANKRTETWLGLGAIGNAESSPLLGDLYRECIAIAMRSHQVRMRGAMLSPFWRCDHSPPVGANIASAGVWRRQTPDPMRSANPSVSSTGYVDRRPMFSRYKIPPTSPMITRSSWVSRSLLASTQATSSPIASSDIALLPQLAKSERFNSSFLHHQNRGAKYFS